jgi:hypothetical protein
MKARQAAQVDHRIAVSAGKGLAGTVRKLFRNPASGGARRRFDQPLHLPAVHETSSFEPDYGGSTRVFELNVLLCIRFDYISLSRMFAGMRPPALASRADNRRKDGHIETFWQRSIGHRPSPVALNTVVAPEQRHGGRPSALCKSKQEFQCTIYLYSQLFTAINHARDEPVRSLSVGASATLQPMERLLTFALNKPQHLT